MKSPDIRISRMKRNTVYILGSVSFFFWLGITYFLFLQKPNSQNTNLMADQIQRNKNLDQKIDNISNQLKEQLKTNSILLKKLILLKGSIDNTVDIKAVLELLDNPNMEVSEVLKQKEQKNLLERIKPPIGANDGHKNLPNYIKDGVKDEPSYKVVEPLKSGEVKTREIFDKAVDDEETAKKKDIPVKSGDDKQRRPVEDEDTGWRNGDIDDEREIGAGHSHPVIPLLLFSCNRVTVNRALDLLLAYRPSKKQFPIIVTQDCGHKETREVIESYGDQIIYIQQPDLSEPNIPPKEKKFKGYFKIARHYGWALNKTFNEMGFEQVIVVEDDLEISPDFFEYFAATLPILKADKSLWCVSAWNDNGKAGLINETSPELLYRTDFFPGLGWMLTKELWAELMVKWPRSYWDDWLREPAQRKDRSCIRPEISRTKTFGKVGVSNGMFYEKHLKYIVLNKKFVPFTVLDLSFLIKDNYDKGWVKAVYDTPVVNLQDVKEHKVKQKAVRLTYHTREAYKRISKALGIMDDFKSGVPRMAYRGIVSFIHKGIRVYLAPNTNWLGYDPKWA